MRHLRHLSAVLLLLVFATLLSACGDSGSGDDKVHDAEPMAAEQVEETTLANGTEVRVSSADGQTLHVQFREEGDGWTEPEEVHVPTDRWTHEFVVRSVGDTAAINADYWRERVLDDDYPPEHTIQVICHETACADAVPTDGELSTTRFDSEGENAWFRVAEERMSLWSLDEGFTEVDIPGLSRGYTTVRVDGTLLLLVDEEEDDGCRTALYAVAPEAGGPEEVGTTATYDDGRSCAVEDAQLSNGVFRFTTADVSDDLSELDPAYITTFTEEDDGTWQVEEAQNQRIEVPNSQGETGITTLDIDLPDGSTVSLSSTDRQHITAQVLESGSDAWSEAEVIATAPEGTVCRSARSSGGMDDYVAPAALVMVKCGADDDVFLGKWQPTHGILLASDDGHDWISQMIERPVDDPMGLADGTGLAHGANGIFTWRQGDDQFTRLDLPIGEGDGIGVMPDGRRLVRFTGNADPDALCRPTWSLAEVGDGDWGKETKLPKVDAEFNRPGKCAVEKVWATYENGRDIVRTIIHDPDNLRTRWTGGLEPTSEGGWRARDSDDL